MISRVGENEPNVYIYMVVDIKGGFRSIGHSFMAISGHYWLKNDHFSALPAFGRRRSTLNDIHVQVETICIFHRLLLVSNCNIWNIITFACCNISQLLPTTIRYMVHDLERYNIFKLEQQASFAYNYLLYVAIFACCNILQFSNFIPF